MRSAVPKLCPMAESPGARASSPAQEPAGSETLTSCQHSAVFAGYSPPISWRGTPSSPAHALLWGVPRQEGVWSGDSQRGAQRSDSSLPCTVPSTHKNTHTQSYTHTPPPLQQHKKVLLAQSTFCILQTCTWKEELCTALLRLQAWGEGAAYRPQTGTPDIRNQGFEECPTAGNPKLSHPYPEWAAREASNS